ncbi:hypothetical protein [Sphingomonas sp.]|uniref:hypothetical protein n=1 Tax=Sphingomonas sp. TaxID=28214 RepID=UPI000DB21E4F|nr:hypothetical protein [Sphingomonas sp.]PZU10890.1 MAG: hypothetical protein DI605_04525 [Sphingomonas sp.]
MFLLALAATLATPAVAPHQASIDHRGSGYSVSYHPRMETKMKTVGVATGARMSMQRCRWTTTLQVERQIARRDEASAHATLLPAASRTFSGERHGHCSAQGEAKAAIGADKIRDHLASIAAADRGDALAQIDAAYSLAQE